MKRATAADLGRETLHILEAGRYTNVAGTVVEITDLVERSVSGTCTYPPDVTLPRVQLGHQPTHIEVANESTLAAALRLVQEGHHPVALNFASAKHPGGGFFGGARAQEESLARSSGLYACLRGNPMYDFHASQGDAMYSDYAIYSPNVPVFREDEGMLLDQPFLCSFITAPAANAKVVLERNRGRRAELRQVMNRRIRKILAIAAAHGHQALVLGAWGCGVFGNDSQEVTELFRYALDYHFRGVFTKIIFAVLDGSEEGRFIGPFRQSFAPEGR